MSSYDDVLIDTDLPPGAVASRLGELLGVAVSRDRSAIGDFDGWTFELPGVVALLDEADYVDSSGLPLSRFRYDVQFGPADRRDRSAVTPAARKVFDRLVASTGWGLALLSNDLQRMTAERTRSRTVA